MFTFVFKLFASTAADLLHINYNWWINSANWVSDTYLQQSKHTDNQMPILSINGTLQDITNLAQVCMIDRLGGRGQVIELMQAREANMLH